MLLFAHGAMSMCFQSLVLHPYGAALRQHPSIFSMIWVASARYQMPVRILHAPLQHPIGCLPANALMICLKSILLHLQLLRRITISPLFLQVCSRGAGITLMSCSRWEPWSCRLLTCFRGMLCCSINIFWILFSDTTSCRDYVALVVGEWMSMDHWWKGTGKGKPKYLEK